MSRRDADRDRQDAAEPGRVRQRRRLDGGAHALDGGERLLGRRVRKHDQQLLAAEPVGHVLAAQAAADRGGDRPQRLVAGEVPELVVVDLEAVDVAQRERERVAACLVAGLEAGQLVGERAAVAHAGQRVATGVLLEPLVEPRELGLAVGQARQRQPLAVEHPAQPALEQGAADHEREPAEQKAGVEDERLGVRGVLNARPEQRREQQHEQPGRQDPAAQPRLRGLGDLASGRRAASAPPTPIATSPSTHSGSSRLSPET